MKPTREFSSKQEKIVASYLDGKLTPNSGATGTVKGDILLPNTLVECKTKTKEAISHTIKKEWIDTMKKECISMGKQNWALVFDFGTQQLQDQMVIIPLRDYLEFVMAKGEYYVE